MLMGYRDGTPKGRCFELPDTFHRVVTEDDANRVADKLRRLFGREPSWQKVRGELIRLARRRMKDE